MRIFLLSLMLFVSKFIFAQTKYDTWVKLSSSPSSILRLFIPWILLRFFKN